MASSSLHGVPRDGSPASSILWDAPTPRRPSRLVRILHEPIPSCRPWFAPLGRGRPTGGQGVVGSGLPIRIDDGNVGVSQVPWKPWWSSSVLFDPGRIRLGGFRVALDMAFRALSKYDFCFVGMGFPEDRSLGMEANGVGSKRILESADQAKSPRRILVRSLLKSRNKLREKYRELRAECKRWRNQAAAVERSRSTWRKRALAHEASAQEDRAARAKLESQLQQLREQSERREVESAELRARLAALEGAEKKG